MTGKKKKTVCLGQALPRINSFLIYPSSTTEEIVQCFSGTYFLFSAFLHSFSFLHLIILTWNQKQNGREDSKLVK